MSALFCCNRNSACRWNEFNSIIAPFTVVADSFDENDESETHKRIVSPAPARIEDDGPPPPMFGINLAGDDASKRVRQQRCITLEDMQKLAERTNRHLRTAELIRKQSHDAKLIVL